MNAAYKGAAIQSMSWYGGLLTLVRAEPDSLSGIVDRIPENILGTLDRENLFEIIRRDYESKETVTDVFLAAQLAGAILYRIALTVENELLDKYDPILDKTSGSSRRQFVPGLRSEKQRRERIEFFFRKNFPE